MIMPLPSRLALKPEALIPVQLKENAYILIVRLKNYAKHTLNILLLKLSESNLEVLSALYNAKHASWLLLISSNEATDVIDAAYSLEKLDNVKSVEILKLTLSNLVNHAGYLKSYGFNLSLFYEKTFVNMLNELRAKWGSGGEALTYYLGYEYGVLSFLRLQRLSGMLNLKLKRRELYDLTTRILCTYSGDVNLVKFDEAGAKVLLRVYNLFECTPFKGKQNRENSQFYRGAISGLSSKAFGLDMVAREVKCVAKGDEYCEFEVSEATRAWS